ncbi:hypothetical protein ACTXT7_016456 [Hymenolepis weldensis]
MSFSRRKRGSDSSLLREGNTSRRLNLQPGFGIRKYHYNSKPQIFDDSESGFWTLNRDGGLPPTSGGSIRRVAAQRRPEQYATTNFAKPRKEIDTFLLAYGIWLPPPN